MATRAAPRNRTHPGTVIAHRRGGGVAGAGVEHRARFRGGARGIALIELAVVLLPVAMVVFTSLDFGVRAKYNNRLRNAAREGAAVAEYFPGRVAGCPAGFEDIESRIRAQDPGLVTLPGFGFTVKTPSGTVIPAACDLDAQPVPPGGKVIVEVTATHGPASLFGDAFLDSTVVARVVVVVQG